MIGRGCLAVACASLAFASYSEAQTLTGTASVIDGDTLKIHGERIRLHGIDAPESAQRCYRAGAPWRCGQKASMALADRIGRNPVTCEGRERDRYGRLVAVCGLLRSPISAARRARSGGETINDIPVRMRQTRTPTGERESPSGL